MTSSVERDRFRLAEHDESLIVSYLPDVFRSKWLPWRWGLVVVALALIFALGTGYNLMFRMITGLAGCLLLIEPLAHCQPIRLHRQDRAQTWLLAGMALLFLIQFITLQPETWGNLGGRDLYVTGDYLMFGAALPRPLTLDPDATLGSLLFLVPAFAALLWARTDRAFPGVLAAVFIAVLTVSALLAFVQLTAGPGSFRLYHDTAPQPPSGLFGNRNHQAIAMACGIPLIAAMIADHWRLLRLQTPHARLLAFGISTGVCVIVALLSASRAGCALLIPAILAGWAIMLKEKGQDARTQTRRYLIWIGVFLAAVALILALVTIWSPGGPLALLFKRSMLGHDARYGYWPPVIDAIWKYAPWGTGFGTFTGVFEVEEPTSLLSPLYIAYAHNDWLQLTMEGGIPAALLALLFLAWSIRRASVAWGTGQGAALPRAAAVVVFLLLAHSIVDFPLRGTALSVLFGGCCGLLATTAPLRIRA